MAQRNNSPYTDLIRENLAAIGKIGTDPRAVEEWMRVAHPTLDHLSRAEFRHEVIIAVACIEVAATDPTAGDPALDSDPRYARDEEQE